MRTARHPRRYLAPLAGTGFILVSLLGCLSLPAASVSGVELTAYQYYQEQRAYQGQHDYRGHQDRWGHRHGRPHRRPRSELPDRYTIHKGKKCELRCERIWGTRDYRCREYRC